ncbi:MAG TPA: flavin reductase family protein [Steroidobacteraceae bacterium]|nr:flavin reductase family protein [Steroidobacteraceae bacterium]
MAQRSEPSCLTHSEHETRRLRSALGMFPTGIVVVTAGGASGPLGMTMNSFVSVSLTPPLILFSIDRRSMGLAAWQRAPGYAVNILASAQQELSTRFARALTDKWRDVGYRSGLHDAPLLDGALACFECTRHGTFDGGDHVVFLARVERFTCADDEAQPLVFHRGRYTSLATGPAAQPELQPAWPLSIHY